MLSLLPVTLSFAASGSRPGLSAPSRLGASTMAATWSSVEGTKDRAANLAVMDELKESGDATLWNTMRLAPRSVSLRELSQMTKIDEKALQPGEEFSLEDIQDTFIKVIVGCSVTSIAWAVGSDALGLDAGLRFTFTYLLAGIPIGILAIGSVAPGILFLPIEAYRAATANEEEKRTRDLRVCKHEASHLLCSYVLGLPIAEVSVSDPKGPRVVVYDEEAMQRPGQLIPAEQINSLAIVAMSGLMAEADFYGKALGAGEDLKVLNNVLLRCTPALPAEKQQDVTRYAALMAWTIIKKHERAFDAITAALEGGKSLGECMQAAEDAEKGQAAASKAGAAAEVKAQLSETPQERAARERAEDAARGKF